MGAVVLFAIVLARREALPRSWSLWTAVLALAVRHQKTMTSGQAAGLIVGFAGAVLIFSPWRTGA